MAIAHCFRFVTTDVLARVLRAKRQKAGANVPRPFFCLRPVVLLENADRPRLGKRDHPMTAVYAVGWSPFLSRARLAIGRCH